jgi:hypothetical protein
VLRFGFGRERCGARAGARRAGALAGAAAAPRDVGLTGARRVVLGWFRFGAVVRDGAGAGATLE